MPEIQTRFTPRVSTSDRSRDPKTGKTLQQFKDECDINKIVKRYGDPRLFEEAMRAQDAINKVVNPPKYGDFSEFTDLQEAFQAVHEAEAMFMALPSEVRSRFDNDPVKMAKFVQDEKNFEEAVKLGILRKKAENVSTAVSNPLSATPVAEQVKTSSQEV